MSACLRFVPALLLVLMAGARPAAAAEPITLKVHHFLGAQSVQHTIMLRRWCDNVARDSGGRLQCRIFPAMQLGGTVPQLYDQARDGVADIVWTVAGVTAGRFPKIEVFELPFLMTDAEATSRAAWDFYERFAKDEFADVHMLAVHVHGPGNLYTRKRAVKSLADLRGLKLRAPTRQTTKMLGALGAIPVGMPLPAVPDALSKGVLDGTMVPYQGAGMIKLDELTRYTTEMAPGQPALYTVVFVMPMNRARYESLPDDLKAVIDRNSGREFSAFLARTMVEDDAVGKAKLVAAGHAITVLSPGETAKWRQATSRLDDAWVAEQDRRGQDGRKLLEAARELVRTYSH